MIGYIFKTLRFPSRSTVLRKSIAITIYLKIILILEAVGATWSYQRNRPNIFRDEVKWCEVR